MHKRWSMVAWCTLWGNCPSIRRQAGGAVGGIEGQTKQALRNVAAILKAAGSSLDRVIKTTVYIADMSLWNRVNVMYARMFGDHCPARAMVPTRELHHGFQIEIEAIAATSEGL